MNSHELTQANVEQGLLGAIGTDIERLLSVQEALKQEDFVAWSPVFDFIVGHAAQYGNPPTADQIVSRFEDWFPPVGEFQYWLDELNRYTLARKAQMAIRDVLPDIEDAPEVAVADLIARLSILRSRVTRRISPTTDTISLRVDAFQRRVDAGLAFQGIETGFKPLDNSGQGWMNGEIIGILARPSVGKTWTLIREGVIAWANGARVLLISPEMPTSQTELRVDTVMAGILGMPISHKALVKGDSVMTKPYHDLMDAIAAESGAWFTIDSEEGDRLSPASVKRYAQQYGADIVLLDGMSFLEDDRKADQDYVRMRNICMDLKASAVSLDYPLIMNHWAINNNRGRRNNNNDATVGRGDDWIMPTMNDAAFGDAFVGVSDTVICLVGDRDSKYFTWYSVRKSRGRELEDWLPRLPIGWLVDRGIMIDFSEFGAEPIWEDLYKKFREATGVNPDA